MNTEPVLEALDDGNTEGFMADQGGDQQIYSNESEVEGHPAYLGNVISDVLLVLRRFGVFEARLVLVGIGRHEALYRDQD